MTMKVTAITSVHLKTGARPITPGTVFELEERVAKDLVARKAVRRPTEDELHAYAAAKAAKAEAEKPSDSEKPSGDGKGAGDGKGQQGAPNK